MRSNVARLEAFTMHLCTRELIANCDLIVFNSRFEDRFAWQWRMEMVGTHSINYLVFFQLVPSQKRLWFHLFPGSSDRTSEMNLCKSINVFFSEIFNKTCDKSSHCLPWWPTISLICDSFNSFRWLYFISLNATLLVWFPSVLIPNFDFEISLDSFP